MTPAAAVPGHAPQRDRHVHAATKTRAVETTMDEMAHAKGVRMRRNGRHQRTMDMCLGKTRSEGRNAKATCGAWRGV